MIQVAVGANGTVVVKTKSRRCWRVLRELKYIKRVKTGVGRTWWTYVKDLIRDLEDEELRWLPEARPRLRALVDRVRHAVEGDDDEVLAAFGVKKPYAFQLEAIHAGLLFERIVLADSTGLGKTIEALGVLFTAIARGNVRRAIIVTPKGLKQQWYGEILDFAGQVPEPVVVSSGAKAKRKILYGKSWRVLIVNPKQISLDFDMLKRVVKDVDFVVLDEASSIRNEDTDLNWSMRTLFKKTRYKLAATATPVENRLRDLRAVIRFVEPRAFISKQHFNERYVVWGTKHVPVKTRHGGSFDKKILFPKKYKNLGEVRAKIKPCYIRRQVSDVGLELPELIVIWEELDLPPRQLKIYEAVRQRLADKIAGLRGKALRAPLQALRQACNHTELVTKNGHPGRPGKVKVDRLRELLDTDLAGEQVVIFTDYERFGRILARDLSAYDPCTYMGPDSKRARQHAIDAFKLGDKRLLIGTKALERGHNLQNAAVVVNADLPWNPGRLKQRIGRTRRLNSEHATNRLINMITKNTVEERLIKRRIYEKRGVFEAVLGQDELSEADPIEGMVGADIRRLL